MKKTAAVVMFLLLFVAGCKINIADVSEISAMPVNLGENPKFENWQDAYIEIIKNMTDYLADPYEERSLFEEMDLHDPDNLRAYIAIHDFDGDALPELIIGDDFSVGVFTCTSGNIIKIADLYTPESWRIINGIVLKNNRMLLCCAGSDGCGYTNFGYLNGEYMTGSYDEYAPDELTVNGKPASLKEFNDIFDVSNWRKLDKIRKKHSISKIRLKKVKTGKWIIKLEDGTKMKVCRNMDFTKLCK